ncbi:hypothetical protein ECP030529313_2176, partial [Escherichia coli p0305293.13]
MAENSINNGRTASRVGNAEIVCPPKLTSLPNKK